MYLRTKVRQDVRIGVISVLLFVLTLWLWLRFFLDTLREWGSLLSALCSFLAYIFLEFVFNKEKEFRIPADQERACFLRKQEIVCLQLPDGHWVGVKARSQRSRMLEAIRALYGKRMSEEDS